MSAEFQFTSKSARYVLQPTDGLVFKDFCDLHLNASLARRV